MLKLTLLVAFLVYVIAAPTESHAFMPPDFKVVAVDVKGRTEVRTRKMNASLQLFERVMNDPEFQKQMLAENFHYDVDNDPNKSLTSREAVDKLWEADELNSGIGDRKAQITWHAKKRNFFVYLINGCSVLGYGYASQISINSYTCFIDKASLADLTGHIAHEWSHKIGFQHQMNDHDKRDETLPYRFGSLVAEHAKRVSN